MKAYRESRGITPLILNLGSRWRGMLNFTPRPLCPRERTPVHIELLASWAPEPVWTCQVSNHRPSIPYSSHYWQIWSGCRIHFCNIWVRRRGKVWCDVWWGSVCWRNALNLYSRGVRFESMLAHELSYRKFCVALPSSSASAHRVSITSQPPLSHSNSINLSVILLLSTGRDSSVGIATRYGLEGTGIECRWERDFPHLSRSDLGPTQPPVQWVPGLSRR